MEYQQLGQSTLKVSKLSFGCMSLKGTQLENVQLLHQAIDLGINFFDTADLYDKGLNEESVGKALKEKRQQLIIATKVGNQWRPDGSGWDWNPTKAYIKKAVHQSLKRLQTDYIDLYQLHGGTIDDPIDETIEAFEELKQEGHIRFYGISSIRPNVIREYIKRSNISSVMMQYSILDRRSEESCLDLLAQHQIGVIVRGAVAKGLLAGKPVAPYLGHSMEVVQKAQDILQEISSQKSMAQSALQFCLAHPAVSTIAAGIRTEEQLLDNASVFEVPSLRLEELDRLRHSISPKYYDKHR